MEKSQVGKGSFSFPTLALCSDVTFFYFERGNLWRFTVEERYCPSKKEKLRNKTVGTLSKQLVRQLSALHFARNEATVNTYLYRI